MAPKPPAPQLKTSQPSRSCRNRNRSPPPPPPCRPRPFATTTTAFSPRRHAAENAAETLADHPLAVRRPQHTTATALQLYRLPSSAILGRSLAASVSYIFIFL